MNVNEAMDLNLSVVSDYFNVSKEGVAKRVRQAAYFKATKYWLYVCINECNIPPKILSAEYEIPLSTVYKKSYLKEKELEELPKFMAHYNKFKPTNIIL